MNGETQSPGEAGAGARLEPTSAQHDTLRCIWEAVEAILALLQRMEVAKNEPTHQPAPKAGKRGPNYDTLRKVAQVNLILERLPWRLDAACYSAGISPPTYRKYRNSGEYAKEIRSQEYKLKQDRGFQRYLDGEE